MSVVCQVLCGQNPKVELFHFLILSHIPDTFHSIKNSGCIRSYKYS